MVLNTVTALGGGGNTVYIVYFTATLQKAYSF